MHELLARDVQRECGALVDHPLRRDDVQHRSGQRFVESAGPQLRRVWLNSISGPSTIETKIILTATSFFIPRLQ